MLKPGIFWRRSIAALLGAGLTVAISATTRAGPAIPDFSSNDRAWIRVGIPFIDPPTGLGVIKNDPDHPYGVRGVDAQGKDVGGRPNAPDWRNPNLKPWASQILKQHADNTDKGITRITAESSCWPGGVPGQMTNNEPLFILQTPREVTLIYQRDHQVRHVYMNVPHSQKPAPSWFGESVGHYEGDELVVDTIGLNDKTSVDMWGTPHTALLHVTERYKIADGGKTLNVIFTVEDPNTFNRQWGGVAVYHQVKGPIIEAVCAENNMDYFTGKMFPIPQSPRSEF